jgi:Uma2 family endonuclease
MSAISTAISPSRSRRNPIPPLQSGDRLSRAEFERRYDATPNLKKAELIEGVVFMPPPVAQEGHSSEHFDIITILGIYRIATPGIEGGDNGSLRLDLDNMPQPDTFLRILESHGGQSRIDADRYVEGAPEFVAEVAATSASHDLHAKLNVYRRNGVKEYLVWRTLDRAIDFFILQDGNFESLPRNKRGVFQSKVFPGLWLDPDALVSRNMVKVESVMRKGIASREHAAFVATLKKEARSKHN